MATTTTTTYSSMAKFIGKNLIKGKLTWSKVTTNKNYSPYQDEALAYINSLGYMIDDDGNCVEIPEDTSDTTTDDTSSTTTEE